MLMRHDKGILPLVLRFMVATALGLSLACLPALGQFDVNEIDPFGDEPAETTDPMDGTTPEGPAGEANAQDVFEQGVKLAGEGNCAEAIELFSQVLSAAPSYAPAALERGKCLAEIGEIQLALQSLGDAVNYGQRYPGVYATALAERGKVLLDAGTYQEAVDDFSLAVQSSPSNTEYLFLRGKALIRTSRTQNAAYTQGGVAEYYHQALASLDRAIELDENYAEAYVERGDAHTAMSEFDMAIDDFERASELDQANSKTKAQLGFALVRKSDMGKRSYDPDMDEIIAGYERALTSFEEYLVIEDEKANENEDPEGDHHAGDHDADDHDAGGHDAGGHDAGGHHAGGHHDHESIEPEQVYLARAVVKLSLANALDSDPHALYHAAIDDSEKALEYDAQMVSAMFQKGVAQRLLGDLDDAAETFTNVLHLNPGFAEAQLRRGIVYFYLGEPKLARGDFFETIRFTEQPDGRASFWLGVTHANEGNYRDAIRMFTNAIRINPAYKPAYNNRALVHMKLGEYDRAVKDFDELLRRDQKDSVARQRRDMARQLLGE